MLRAQSSGLSEELFAPIPSMSRGAPALRPLRFIDSRPHILQTGHSSLHNAHRKNVDYSLNLF